MPPSGRGRAQAGTKGRERSEITADAGVVPYGPKTNGPSATADGLLLRWGCGDRIRRHSAKHDADHGHPHDGFGHAAMALEIASQAAVLADPAQLAFDYPPLRQHGKSMRVAVAHELNGPAVGAGHGRRHPRPLISGTRDNPLDEREPPSRLAQQRLCAVAFLHIGRCTTTPSNRPMVSVGT